MPIDVEEAHEWIENSIPLFQFFFIYLFEKCFSSMCTSESFFRILNLRYYIFFTEPPQTSPNHLQIRPTTISKHPKPSPINPNQLKLLLTTSKYPPSASNQHQLAPINSNYAQPLQISSNHLLINPSQPYLSSVMPRHSESSSVSLIHPKTSPSLWPLNSNSEYFEMNWCTLASDLWTVITNILR